MATQRNFKLVVMLALIAGLGPISIHVILPVLPSIETAFGASDAVTQLTLTLGVVTMAISTIGYGPAADRFGRKPVILFGLVMFVAGSALCVWSANIEVLIFGRVVQAIGGAAGLVISRAIIRDMFSREQSARVIGQVMSIVIIAPIVAPVVGGFLAEFAGWRYVFVLAVAMGAISLVVAVPGVRETHTPDTGSNILRQMLRAFPELLRTPAFLAYAGYAGCGMGMFMVIAGGMPFVMVEVFDASPSAFGLWFMLMTGSFLLGTVLSSRFTERIGLDRMIRWGSAGAALSAIAIPALLLAGFITPWAIFAPGFFMGTCHGLAMPNAQAGAVSVNPRIAGSASGLVMFLQMTIGAGFGQIAGMLPHASPVPVAILVGCAGIGGFLLYSGAMLFHRQPNE
ncbi:MAG: multidrug effflux MFS transporter [Alphaproteobacteria bacterium]|nr:multidrug effflux MFS transporter [Alphaproteobacteria bacterium]